MAIKQGEFPSFNGLSRDAFEAGHALLRIVQGLERNSRVEVAPHIIQHIVYELLGDGCRPEEIDVLIDAARENLRCLEHYRIGAEASLRPFKPRPEDDY